MVRRHACRVLTSAVLLSALTLTTRSAAEAATPTDTMGGSTFMISTRELGSMHGLGRYERFLCGYIAARNVPCQHGNIPVYPSYAQLARAIKSGNYPTVMFDQEGSPATPVTEQQHQFWYIRLAGQLAKAHHVDLIDAPVPIGYTTPAARQAGLIAVDEQAARSGDIVDIQDQFRGDNPTGYAAFAQQDVDAMRQVNPSVIAIDNLSTDPGGYVVGRSTSTPAQSAQIMYQSFLAARSIVKQFWLELPVWRPPTAENCDSTGCPKVGLALLHLLGVTQ